MADLPPNHHGDHPRFTGLFGYVAGLTMVTGRSRDAGEITWVQAGAEDMPLPDRSFDVCWSLAIVHHWPDLEAGMDEVERVLRPGGSFIALEKEAAPGATGNAGHGWTPQQADTFAAMLRSRGFTGVDVTNHDLGAGTRSRWPPPHHGSSDAPVGRAIDAMWSQPLLTQRW